MNDSLTMTVLTECTGDAARAVLRQALPGRIFSMRPGLTVLMA